MLFSVKNNYHPLLLGAALGLLLLAVSIIAALYGMQRTAINAGTAQAIERLPHAADDALQRDADLLLNLMLSLLDDRTLQSAWLERDRSRLLALTEKRFADYRNRYHLTHLYFTAPDRTNVLRVHDPLHFGDIINRHTTIKALELNQNVYGIELGVFGSLTLRVVHPWIIDGQLTGLVEFGKSLDHLMARVEQPLGLQVHYLIDKSQIERSGWQNGMNLFHHHHWNTLQEYLIIGRAEPELIETWKLLLSVPTNTTTLHDIDAGNRFYQAGVTDLIDASGDTIGKTLLLRDVTAEHLALMHHLLRNGSLAAAIALAAWCGLFLHLRRLSRRSLAVAHAPIAAAGGEDVALHGGRFPDALVQIDMEGYVCGWNAAAERLFNITRLEALGRHCHFIFDPASLPDLQTSLITPLLNDGGAVMEARLCRKNGRVFEGRLSCAVIYDADRRP
jgi:PAS domain S-box-containing protein